MTDSEQPILIIQPDDSQRMIWERVLLSQQLQVQVDTSGRSPLATLASCSARGQEFAVVLLDWTLGQEQWLGWLTLCERQNPSPKTILLLAQNIDPEDRKAAEESGAAETIDWVNPADPITNVIAGTRRVLRQLRDVAIDKDALVESLMQFKRLLSEPQGSTSQSSPPPEPEVQDNSAPSPSPSEPPSTPDAADDSENRRSDGRRRYRGQTY